MINPMNLNQVKIDFENTKKRIYLAQYLKAQGMSKTEVMAIIDANRQPDMIDLILKEIE